MTPMSRNEAAERLRQALERLSRGHRPMYNGRPSCPICGNFVDSEETHVPGCLLTTDVLDAALDAAYRKGYKHGYEAAKKEDPRSMLRAGEEARDFSIYEPTAPTLTAERLALAMSMWSDPDGTPEEQKRSAEFYLTSAQETLDILARLAAEPDGEDR